MSKTLNINMFIPIILIIHEYTPQCKDSILTKSVLKSVFLVETQEKHLLFLNNNITSHFFLISIVFQLLFCETSENLLPSVLRSVFSVTLMRTHLNSF